LITEAELISRLQQKDEWAFQHLVKTHKDRVYAIVFNLLQDEHDADDTAQEVFIQIYESIHRFQQEAKLGTWIYRIAVRKAIDKLRSIKARNRLHKIFPWWMPTEEGSKNSVAFHPGVIAEQKEKAAALLASVRKLPVNQQTAFTLIRLQGMPYEEAASLMNMSIKAVESLISRAKTNLQKYLENHYTLHK